MQLEHRTVLRPFTTLNVGGAAEYFVRVATLDDVKEAITFAQARHLSVTILGGGSNMLIADLGVPGLVIKMELLGIDIAKRKNGTVEVVAGAGESWDVLVGEVVARGLWGIENLSHIPGTVGAAPVQNIGAYGQEVGERIVWVEVFDTHTLSTRVFSKEDCRFGYRDSVFKSFERGRHIITKVCFALEEQGAPNLLYPDLVRYFEHATGQPMLAEIREAVIAIRSRKFPQGEDIGTAGSFFKNPVIPVEHFEKLKEIYTDLPGFPAMNGIKVPLAWLLERTGAWKGCRMGNVGCFERQPLVLVTYPGASALECVRLAKKIADDIYAKTNMVIVPEVVFVGHVWESYS